MLVLISGWWLMQRNNESGDYLRSQGVPREGCEFSALSSSQTTPLVTGTPECSSDNSLDNSSIIVMANRDAYRNVLKTTRVT